MDARGAIARSGLFDAGWYRDRHGLGPSDDALGHYLTQGDRQGIRPHPLFHTDWYRRRQGLSAEECTFAHFLAAPLGSADPCPLFHVRWYLQGHPGLAESGLHPLEHYRRTRHRPNPLFDPAWYRKTMGLMDWEDPLAHYCASRQGKPCAQVPAEPKGAPAEPTLLERLFTSGLRAGCDPWHRRVQEPWRALDVERERHESETLAALPGDPGRLVSVVIPVRDRSEFLKACLASALAQTHRCLEFWVVDDHSRQDIRAVCASFGDPRIHYVKNTGRAGAAHARNLALDHAQGFYTCFFDSDNVFEPRMVELLLKAALAKDAGLAYCGAQFVPAGPFLHMDFDRAALYNDNFLDMNTLMVRTGLLRDKNIRFDEDILRMSDYDFVLSVVEHLPDSAVAGAYIKGVIYDDSPRPDRLSVRHPSVSSLERIFMRHCVTQEWSEAYFSNPRRWARRNADEPSPWSIRMRKLARLFS